MDSAQAGNLPFHQFSLHAFGRDEIVLERYVRKREVREAGNEILQWDEFEIVFCSQRFSNPFLTARTRHKWLCRAGPGRPGAIRADGRVREAAGRPSCPRRVTMEIPHDRSKNVRTNSVRSKFQRNL